MNLIFKDKVVIVTGAARGVGVTAAHLFSKSGARVIALDINERVAELKKDIAAEAWIFDVTSLEAWKELSLHVRNRYGRLDVMVNNAATEGACRFEDCTLDAWNRIINVNLTGVFLGSQFAVRLMRDNPSKSPGNIVNVSSVAATLSVASDVAYTASKGGVISLTRATAHYCAREQLPIRCNSISPGAIQTEMLDQFVASTPDPAATQAALNSIQPVNRLASPEEIARAILYAASEESSFMTGSDLVIDGGASTSARL